MNLDDLKSNWQEKMQSTGAPENLTEYITMLEQKTVKIDNDIKRRDRLEIGVALLLIPAWIFGLFVSVSLIQTLGFIVAIVSCLYIPYKLVQAKQIEPSKSDSTRAFLENERQKLVQQKQLLESVFWWYLGPLGLSIGLITLGATANEAGIPQPDIWLTTYLIAVIVLYASIYVMNKKAAKKKFTPLLENIDKKLSDIAL